MIEFVEKPYREVEQEEMERVYETLKTPYKYGGIIKYEDDLCDSPTVFFHKGKWYMSYVTIAKKTATSGYSSHLSVSDDLVHWTYLFPTLSMTKEEVWDCNQIALHAAFVENDFYGKYRLQKVNDAYHFSYVGGALKGYETDPLFIGQAKTKDVLVPEQYQRGEKPVLSPYDADARQGEKRTLYKSCMFIDESQTLGYKFVNTYNGKNEQNKESIFLAVSNDGEKWERYGDKAIIVGDNENVQINGDPQILKLGDLYIMIYFMLEAGKAFNTFACSYDLIHWKKWNGKKLIESEYDWENVYAHKNYVVVKDEIVYHFYCAVNDKNERFIALATSKELKK